MKATARFLVILAGGLALAVFLSARSDLSQLAHVVALIGAVVMATVGTTLFVLEARPFRKSSIRDFWGYLFLLFFIGIVVLLVVREYRKTKAVLERSMTTK